MQRHKAAYIIAEGQLEDTKKRMLNWANQFGILLFLDSNSYKDVYGRYDCLLAAGAEHIIDATATDAFTAVQQWHDAHKDWLLGNVNYDYKNAIEPKLSSAHQANIGFPDFYFFQPQVVCYIGRNSNTLNIECLHAEPLAIYLAITAAKDGVEIKLPKIQFRRKIDKDVYLRTIAQLRNHIKDGDCYEINYCTEGYCENAVIDPLTAFNNLNQISPAPFAAYYRNGDKYMMCASPERYLNKHGDRIIAQPIKGTARRSEDEATDESIKHALQHNIKERAENVMIVDLMRNDLARCCEVGSVAVDELFGIYTFPQVHQMISTISGKLTPGKPFTQALRYSFPMGSMTGAPKIKVMQLIEQYEHSRRELFSGTVGYITPNGDFDFNVIIRSLFYNATTQYLNYLTGGAITYDSTPEQEYEEMRLKAWALERVFE